MKTLREFIDIVSEQPATKIKTVDIAWDQRGEHVLDVQDRDVVDADRFVRATAQKLQSRFGDEFFGYTTTDNAGTWAISNGETQVMIVLDTSSPWFDRFNIAKPAMPAGFWDYYEDRLNY